jgi:hypothetical protein
MDVEENKYLCKEEHVEHDKNFKLNPVKIFRFTVNPFLLLTISTSIVLVMYIVFIIAGVKEHHGNDVLPSVSTIIAHSKAMTITFTFIVYIHSYCLYAYLVIISEYIGTKSLLFYAISTSCFLYVLCLIIVTYLPLTSDETEHNVFAVGAFAFSLISVLLHKHSWFVYSSRGYSISCNSYEGLMLFIEIVEVIVIVIMGGLFWFYSKMWAEYVFIFIILMDKHLKVTILSGTNLIYLEGSYIQHSYYSSPNPKDPNFTQHGFDYH